MTEIAPPHFVRDLPAGGVETEPLTLDPEVQADLNQRTDEMRAARDAAAANGASYLVMGGRDE